MSISIVTHQWMHFCEEKEGKTSQPFPEKFNGKTGYFRISIFRVAVKSPAVSV